jgi:hypothetical protein
MAVTKKGAQSTGQEDHPQAATAGGSLSTEVVDNSVDFKPWQSSISAQHCIFVNLAKK